MLTLSDIFLLRYATPRHTGDDVAMPAAATMMMPLRYCRLSSPARTAVAVSLTSFRNILRHLPPRHMLIFAITSPCLSAPPREKDAMLASPLRLFAYAHILSRLR